MPAHAERFAQVEPGAIGVARQVLAEQDSRELKAMARRILRMPTVEEIEKELIASLGRHVRT